MNPSGKTSKIRLDQLLVERGLVESRSKAQALIMAGRVRVAGVERPKAGLFLPVDASVEVTERSPWVGRGGEKLSGAIEDLAVPLPLAGSWLDCGAGTGGFSQVLLKNGAEKVYAIDVGYGQLDPLLRSDPRVVVLERTNIRSLDPSLITEPLSGASLDLSFISARLVLPLLVPRLAPSAQVIQLFKPQFEAEKHEVGKGGIIRDDDLRAAIRRRFTEWLVANGWTVLREAPSRIAGQDGNREHFFLLTCPRFGQRITPDGHS